MFALGIDFLRGVAVITDAANREKAEWPPHPARIFMAMVAAHYESRPLPGDGEAAISQWNAERAVLEWLEALPAPEMHWPESCARAVVKVYVPVNDKFGGDPKTISSRDLRSADERKERTFPSVSIQGDDASRFVYLIWEDITPDPERAETLKKLTAKVTRIGHSSSLVQMWLTTDILPMLPRFTPENGKKTSRRGQALRIPAMGFLSDLDQRFNAKEIETFFELSGLINTSTGRAKAQAKAEFEKRFGIPWKNSLSAPVRQRPQVGLTAEYHRKEVLEAPPAMSFFDPELFVLAKLDGPVLGLESTAKLTAALRGILLQNSESKPEWFTGHSAPGVPSTGGHMALLPLAYVGTEYADGHVLGLAIAFPRHVSAKERAECLRGVLFLPDGSDQELKLVLGDCGEWTLLREERSSPPLALRPSTWTDPSDVWASVTPVVLDKHPDHDMQSMRPQWQEEVAAIICESCERQGLPRPEIVDVDKTSWHRGAPRSRPTPNGMPLLPVKTGQAARQQVHVLLRFPCLVQGPLLLGAGRYRGYGLCKPLGHQP